MLVLKLYPSIYFNLDLDIVDKDYVYDAGDEDADRKPQPSVGTIEINSMSTPELNGASKEIKSRGYELVHWREIKPSN